VNTILNNSEVDTIYRCLAEEKVSMVERYSIANKLLELKKKHKKIRFVIWDMLRDLTGGAGDDKG